MISQLLASYNIPPAPPSGSPTVRNARKANTSGATVAATAAFNSVTGDTLHISISDGAGQGAVTFTDNAGNASGSFVQVGTTLNGGGGSQLRRFVCQNALGTTGHIVTATWASSSDATFNLLDIAGAAASSLDSGASAQVADTSQPWEVTSTPSVANTLAIASMTPGDPSGTIVVGGGFTKELEETNGALYWRGCVASAAVGAAAAQTPSFTIAAGPSNAAVAIDFIKA